MSLDFGLSTAVRNYDDVFDEQGAFPSLQRRGGGAIKKMMRSHRSGADGVVAHT